jgi:hypothetical protein
VLGYYSDVPTVLRQTGFEFRIYTTDHSPVDVHVWKAGREVVINLGDRNVKPYVRENRGMRKRDEIRALRIAAIHQLFLIGEWMRIHGYEQGQDTPMGQMGIYRGGA